MQVYWSGRWLQWVGKCDKYLRFFFLFFVNVLTFGDNYPCDNVLFCTLIPQNSEEKKKKPRQKTPHP